MHSLSIGRFIGRIICLNSRGIRGMLLVMLPKCGPESTVVKMNGAAVHSIGPAYQLHS